MYKLWGQGVLRKADCTFIPPDETLSAWREYEEWLKKGNTPEPEITAEEQAVLDAQKAAEETAKVLEVQKAADIASNLPSWEKVKAAIDAAFTDVKQNAVVTKLARVVYWLAKGSAV